jgi:polyhydroxybutyrate depolymerase
MWLTFPNMIRTPALVTRRLQFAATVVVASATLLAGCSGDDTGNAANDDSDLTASTVIADPASAPAVPSAGCTTATANAVTEERVEVAIADPDTGENRWYLVTTPPANDGDAPLPLVLDFHGLSEGAVVHAGHSAMSSFAVANDFVVAFPQGTGDPVRWRALPTSNPQNVDSTADLAYTDAVLDQLEADLCIDTSRIYATGLSNGAGMSSLLACARPDRIAAVAPVAGLRPPLECDAATTTPVLSFHGTVDPILLYNGGVADIGALLSGAGVQPAPAAVIDGDGYPAAARAWAVHNACGTDPAVSTIGSDIQHWVFDCPAGSDVEFYVVIDGGHSWPGSEFSRQIANIVGPTTFTVSANEVMWEFFTRHRLATS